jgi:large subunit ribosomal protein L9
LTEGGPAVKVILKQDVHNLGKAGDVVNVAPGFGRNFLIPKSLAVPADAKSVKQIGHQKMVIAQQQEKSRREAMALSDKIENFSCTIRVEVGEQEKLYGSVTAKDIEQALTEEGLNIARKQILLEEAIKVLGVHTVGVKLHHDVTAKLKVWVVAK